MPPDLLQHRPGCPERQPARSADWPQGESCDERRVQFLMRSCFSHIKGLEMRDLACQASFESSVIVTVPGNRTGTDNLIAAGITPKHVSITRSRRLRLQPQSASASIPRTRPWSSGNHGDPPRMFNRFNPRLEFSSVWACVQGSTALHSYMSVPPSVPSKQITWKYQRTCL